MSYISLPEDLRQRVRRYKRYKWNITRGVELDSLARDLPRDLRRDIKRHLCLPLLNRVPFFEEMDEHLLDAMCDRLKPVLYTEKSVIVREGDPVPEMLFITRGTVLSTTANGGRSGFFRLDAGDFFGEEILTWALDPTTPRLPFATNTMQADTNVEAFALMADELKFLASQFRLLHSRGIQHTFRFYSQQWRTWAACFIQAAWRRYCRMKLEKALQDEIRRLQDALATGSETSSLSISATIYASRFSTNALRILRRKDIYNAAPMLLQRPAQPNFNDNDATPHNLTRVGHGASKNEDEIDTR